MSQELGPKHHLTNIDQARAEIKRTIGIYGDTGFTALQHVAQSSHLTARIDGILRVKKILKDTDSYYAFPVLEGKRLAMKFAGEMLEDHPMTGTVFQAAAAAGRMTFARYVSEA